MGPNASERVGADDERARSGAQDTFGAVALSAFFDALEEPGTLERLKVVVETLAGKAQPAGEPGSRVGLGQRGQQGAARAPQGRGGGFGAVDDLNWGRSGIWEARSDKLICQDAVGVR